MGEAKVVIVGAGIAGAATAYFLAQRGLRGIVLIEGEKQPDLHSTGRNAGILRSATGDSLLTPIARESAAFYREPPPGFSDAPLIDPVGFFLAATGEGRTALDRMAGNGTRPEPPAELYRRVPALAPGLDAILAYPEEGVLDVAAIHGGFLSGARLHGAELRLDTPVTALRRSEGRVTGVVCGGQSLDAATVVLAGGAWAAALGATAGAPLPLHAHRRHLLVSAPDDSVDPRWPVVWLPGEGFYFRPEEGGLLLCACDDDRVPVDEGERTVPGMEARIRRRAAQWLPGLATGESRSLWAGIRVFAPDRRFVVGPDPRLSGLHWVAGLAGHGISSAAAVGRLAAEWIADGWSAHPSALGLTPDRLLAEPAASGGVPGCGGRRDS